MSDETPKAKPYMDIAELIMDGLGDISDEDLQEMVRTGYVYTPYVPLQVSQLRFQKKAVKP